MGLCVSLPEPRRLPPQQEPVVLEAAAAAVAAVAQPGANLKNLACHVGSAIISSATAKNVDELRRSAGNGDATIFTYNELRVATKNFRPDLVVGEGGFGIVYKGVVDESVRAGFVSTQVAVKVLNRDGLQGEREWLAEVNYLEKFSHPNLVKLIGYCCEDEHRLLVYEYMTCGNLEKHLFRRISLTLPWSTRMKIALGAAKGLACLHGAERPIIYRDFKTSNILLDSDYNAKLSDFGLAKEGPVGDQTHVSTRVMGTQGYAAPEYVMTGHLTARSDVYSFGVVLLEMLTGRRVMDKRRPSREQNLVDWARPLLIHNKKLFKILDSRMKGQYSSKTALKVANLAYNCLSQNPKGRPTMNQVVEILETVQDMNGDGEEWLLYQSWECGVTLYEAPKEEKDSNATENGATKPPKEIVDSKKAETKFPDARVESYREPEMHSRRRRIKAASCKRSQSATPIDDLKRVSLSNSDAPELHSFHF